MPDTTQLASGHIDGRDEITGAHVEPDQLPADVSAYAPTSGNSKLPQDLTPVWSPGAWAALGLEDVATRA
jgi:hypothetical protein